MKNNENHTRPKHQQECLYQITSINLYKNDLRLHTKDHLVTILAHLNDLGFVDTITEEMTDEGIWRPVQYQNNNDSEQNFKEGNQNENEKPAS